jgi:hypothetical protein
MILKFVLYPALAYGVSKILSLSKLSKAGDRLNSRIVSLDWMGVQGTNLYFNLVTEHTNTVNRNILIDLVDIGIFIKGSEIAKIQRDRKGELKASPDQASEINKSFTVEASRISKINFPMIVSLTTLLPLLGISIFDFIKQKTLPSEVVTQGKIVVEGFTQDYNETIPLVQKG